MSDKKYSEKLLEQIFTYHKPSEESIQIMKKIREMSLELAKFIVTNCPDSRELSLALANLEQVSMYANASIARHTPSESSDPH